MHYISRIKTVFVIVCWFIATNLNSAHSSQFAIYSDQEQTVDCSVEQTVDYPEDPDKTIEVPDPITKEELERDLGDSSSVRSQIYINLQLISDYRSMNQDLLCEPVLCIGTGRNQESLKRHHVTPTIIRSIDTCMDNNRNLSPDILLNDAFFLHNELSHILDHSFGIVFFAHVGNQFLPLNTQGALVQSLRIYKDKLVQGGILVCNSEVHQDAAKTLDYFIKRYNCADFNELKQSVSKIFNDAGLIDVEIFIKKELEIYSNNAYSLLVIAKKPLKNMLGNCSPHKD